MHFRFFRWILRTLTGRWAQRVYIVILLLVLSLTAAVRVRTYVISRRVQSVLRGLAELRIDQTPEDQMLKTVPHLTGRYESKSGVTVERWYYTNISNESDRVVRLFASTPSWAGRLASWLGNRYMGFHAAVSVQNGRVSSVRYGLAPEVAWPEAASYMVSAKSVHGFWLQHQHGQSVTSQDDQSPQYRVLQYKLRTLSGAENALGVTFTNDAPPEFTKRAFQLDLSCFWSLRECDDARQIAPGLQQDAEAIQTATLQRLRSGKCPDSIIDARMRYLPDVSVLLLEVTGSRRIDVNEEGSTTEDWFTDYDLKEVIRGHNLGSWRNVRFQRTIPSPMNPRETIANQNWPQTTIGSLVLFFGNMNFESCRFIPASPSALEIVRKMPVPAKRPEDKILTGLL